MSGSVTPAIALEISAVLIQNLVSMVFICNSSVNVFRTLGPVAMIILSQVQVKNVPFKSCCYWFLLNSTTTMLNMELLNLN